MERIEKILSRPVAKPYRTSDFSDDDKPYLNEDGHVDFCEGDIENPANWSARRRWYITIVCITLVLNATFASSIPSGCLEGISNQFKVSTVASGLVITLFLLGYCFGPLFFGPLSEFFGRRWLFYVTFICYVVFNFLCAFAPNFGALLVGRFLTGTFASCPLSNAPGVLADLWGPIERGNGIALFATVTFAGPGLAPFIAGFLELKETWRWSFYVLLMLGGISLVFLLTIPETHPATVLTNKARRIRRRKIPGYEEVKSPTEAKGATLTQIFKIALTRPWIILFDPISFLIAIYLAVTYCLLYMLFTIYPIVFREKRMWNAGVSELPLIGTVIGAWVGGATVFIYSKYKVAPKIESGEGIEPEDRLPLAMLGGIGFFVTMFWFGWSAEYNYVNWAVPTIAGVFLAASIVLIFVSYLNYLTDTYLMYAASAIAANTVARSAAGAAAPLFTNQMFAALGVGGGASLIGGVAALLSVIPFLFYRYGKSIRKRSKFAPTEEKNDEESHEADKDKKESEKGQSDNAASEDDSDASGTSSLSSRTRRGNDEDEERYKKKDDIPQNAFGQPRVENTKFGHEESSNAV